MEVLSTKEEKSGTSANADTQVSDWKYKVVAWRTCHVIPHYSAKGVRNKGGGYTIEYVPGTDLKKTSERYG